MMLEDKELPHDTIEILDAKDSVAYANALGMR